MAAHAEPLSGQPLYRRCDLSTGDVTEQGTLYTVPAGHIFALEMVLAQVFTRGGAVRLVLPDPEDFISAGSRGIPFKLEESFASTDGRFYTVNQLVRLYCREHITIQAYLLLLQSAHLPNEVAISGSLVLDPGIASSPGSLRADI